MTPRGIGPPAKPVLIAARRNTYASPAEMTEARQPRTNRSRRTVPSLVAATRTVRRSVHIPVPQGSERLAENVWLIDICDETSLLPGLLRLGAAAFERKKTRIKFDAVRWDRQCDRFIVSGRLSNMLTLFRHLKLWGVGR